MPIKNYRPYTPTRRFQTVVSRDEITKETPEKILTRAEKRTGGRNSTGSITIRFRGGGHKQAYRDDRLQARQDGHSGQGGRRSSTIRTARRASRC